MKRIFALLLICLIVFIALRRQRIFLRDPLANVTRDGTAVGGVQVMINYTNDVLLQDGSKPRVGRQHLRQVPPPVRQRWGSPTRWRGGPPGHGGTRRRRDARAGGRA